MTTCIKAISLCILSLLYGCTNMKNENEWQIKRFQDQLLLVNNNTKTIYGVYKMAKNTKFCRVANDGASIEYAPVIIPPNPGAPTEEEYNEAGWFKNGIQPPTIPEGKIVSKTTYRYDEVQNAVVANYEFEDAPKVARTFSKFRLYIVLSQLGLWDTFESWLKEQTIGGVNAYTAFSIANDLTDENPMFLGLLEDVKTALQVSDQQAEAILDYADIAKNTEP